MEYIRELAEEASRQLVEEQQQQKDSSDSYVSIFRINGEPILPPLMTKERRCEMQSYKQAALHIEDRLQRERREKLENADVAPGKALKLREQPKAVASAAPLRQAGGQTHIQFVDASTNTELPSLTVFGRIRQCLQRSETLIYDNKYNAIIKPIKSAASARPENQLQLEETNSQYVLTEELVAWAQTATKRNTPQKFAMLHSKWIEPEQPKSSPAMPQLTVTKQQRPSTAAKPTETSPKQPPIEAERPPSLRCSIVSGKQKEHKPENKSQAKPWKIYSKVMPMSQVAPKGKLCNSPPVKVNCENPDQRQKQARELPSDDTSLDSEVSERKSILFLMNATKKLQQHLASREPLQRASTSPALKAFDPTMAKNLNRHTSTECIEKMQPQLWKRCQSMQLNVMQQLAAVNSRSTQPQASSKISVKQRMAPDHLKAKSKAKCATPKPLSSGSNKLPSMPMQRSGNQSAVSNTAHACSHVNAQAVAANNTRRRLSYDPRASLKRSSAQQQKKSNNNNLNNNINNNNANQAKPTPVAKSLPKRSMPTSPSSDAQVQKLPLQPLYPHSKANSHSIDTHTSPTTAPPTPTKTPLPQPQPAAMPTAPPATPSTSAAAAKAISSNDTSLLHFRLPSRLPAHPFRNVEILKRKMMGEMELQQRDRFRQLVSHQAEQQKRLQAEFDVQQQMLIDQLLYDITAYAKNMKSELESPVQPELASPSCSGQSSDASLSTLLLHRAQCLDTDDDSDECQLEATTAAELTSAERELAIDMRSLTTDSENI